MWHEQAKNNKIYRNHKSNYNKENIRDYLIEISSKKIEIDGIIVSDDEKIVMLENIRFYPEEERNNQEFAKHLAALADIYVNDAFSCSHRTHASIHEITKLTLFCFSWMVLLEKIGHFVLCL